MDAFASIAIANTRKFNTHGRSEHSRYEILSFTAVAASLICHQAGQIGLPTIESTPETASPG